MRIYITDAQIPELADFNPAARRFLRQCAFKQMFAERPSLRWLPNTLCIAGALVGLLTLGMLPHSWYGSPDDLLRMFIPNAYMLIIAWLGGFVSSQLLTHRARHYLKRMIETS